MFAEITAAVTAVTQAAKLLGDLPGDHKSKEVIAKLQNGVIDLQGKVYGLQAKHYETAEKLRETEQKLAAVENWGSESSRYALTELAPGIFVYALRPDQAAGEPPHYLCPHCFQQRKKAILHHPTADKSNFVCDGCAFDIRPAKANHPHAQAVPMRPSWRAF
jgi:hypothetical protein